MIQEIKRSQQDIKVRHVQAKDKPAPLQPEKEQTRNNIDTVEFGTNKSPSALYTRPKGKGLKTDDIDGLMTHEEINFAGLRELVRLLLLKQREAAARSEGKRRQDSVNLTPAEEAGLSISEDLEFGVKTISDRIVKFAISISDNDPAKLTQLKEAIDKGFAAAEKTFGGKLPDICYETYDEIMKKLDQWRTGGEMM